MQEKFVWFELAEITAATLMCVGLALYIRTLLNVHNRLLKI